MPSTNLDGPATGVSGIKTLPDGCLKGVCADMAPLVVGNAGRACSLNQYIVSYMVVSLEGKNELGWTSYRCSW